MNAYERGVILSNPIKLLGGGVSVDSPRISPEDIRYSLLFFDKIAWPVNRYIHFGPDADAQFLIGEGIMIRPDPTPPGPISFSGLDGARIVRRMFLESIRILETENPGCWSYGFGKNFTDINLGECKSRSILVDLISTIPIPDGDVPLQDILRFKSQRYDELLRFRIALDRMYDDIIASSDAISKFKSCATELKVAVDDLSRVCREESGFHINLNMKIKFEVGLNAITNGLAGYFIGNGIGQGELGAILGAFSNIVKFESEPSIGVVDPRNSPYCYINSINKGI